MPAINHYLHIPGFTFDLKRDIGTLYLLQAIKVLFEKFALFFLPIFLFEKGAAVVSMVPVINTWELGVVQSGMLAIGLYYSLLRAITALVSFPVGMMLKKFGNRLVLIFAFAVYLVAALILYMAVNNLLIIWFAAMLHGAFIALYFLPANLIIIHDSQLSHLSEDIGLIRVLTQFGNMLAPVLGGIVTVALGYESLFLISLVFMLLAIVVALRLSGKRFRSELSRDNSIELVRNVSFRKMVFSQWGRYINDLSTLIWPVYLFILLGGADKVGYLYAVSFFLAIIISMVGGSYIDHNKSRKPYVGSATSLAGLWISRIFFANPFTIAIIDAGDRLVSNYHWLFFDTMVLRAAKIKNPLAYLTVRELCISIGASMIWLLVGVIFVMLAEGWRGLFILAAIGVLITLLISDRMEYAR